MQFLCTGGLVQLYRITFEIQRHMFESLTVILQFSGSWVCCCCFTFETGSLYTALAGPELTEIPPPLP